MQQYRIMGRKKATQAWRNNNCMFGKYEENSKLCTSCLPMQDFELFHESQKIAKCVLINVRSLAMHMQGTLNVWRNFRTHASGSYVGLAPWAWFSLKRTKPILHRTHFEHWYNQGWIFLTWLLANQRCLHAFSNCGNKKKTFFFLRQHHP